MPRKTVDATSSDHAFDDADAADTVVGTAARLNRLYGKVLQQLSTPLTFRQYRTLIRVAEGYASLTELAAMSNLTLPSVSETVDGLVRRALLTRAEHPQDRRISVLALTPAGKAASAEARQALTEVSTTLLASVPPGDRAVLHRSLQSLYGAATEFFRARGNNA